jgi:alkanesulfonate monooxygenase SsuD/methylene tetrahydromethanopterin reductase-like flavin-dependent oxidoreductase (luciferase family)
MAARVPGPVRFAGIGVWLRPPTADTDVSDLLDRAAAVAGAPGQAGFGSLWVSESTGTSGIRTAYEAYSLLGALAVRTDGIRLGVVADGDERRAPSILAKIVTSVDVISHGRAVLSLDGDCASGPDAERLFEALTVCRSVLEDVLPTYAGRIYSVDAAINRPAPVQAGGVPVVVFLHGSGPARAPLLETAARLADAVVVDGGADGVREACRVVESQTAVATTRGTAVEVLGRIDDPTVGALTADRVAQLRSAGATGCLVGIPFPWSPATVAGVLSPW